MKTLLLCLSTLSLLGFTNVKNSIPSVNDSSLWNKSGYIEPAFTFTNTANDYENVYLFLDDRNPGQTIINYTKKRYAPYQLQPSKCLQITASEFDRLVVIVGAGYDPASIGLLKSKILCGNSDENKCQPNHYEVINAGLIWDNYTIHATEKPNTNGHCMSMTQWMTNKK